MKTNSFIKVTFYLMLTCIGLGLNAQIQIGNRLDGEGPTDYYGWSVDMPNAGTLAIGAYRNQGNGVEAGHARVFRLVGSLWIQQGADIDGENAGDRLGYSVSMPDSTTLAVGAPLNDSSGTDAGHVNIYTLKNNNWTKKGNSILGTNAGDWAGRSVSMPDSNTVAVGAFRNDSAGFEAGEVRIFKWNGNNWIQKGASIFGTMAGSTFGYSVSMPDSNTVAVGAPRHDWPSSISGQVRIFKWNGTAWVQKGGQITSINSGAYLGWSVNMPNPNIVAIGAPGDYANGIKSGVVRIYEWSGIAWAQKGNNINGEAAGDESGWSVSMPDPNTIAIGARQNRGGGVRSGHVRTYAWNGLDWEQKGRDIDGARGSYFGHSVSMPNNNTVAIGAFGFAGFGGADCGQVLVFSPCKNISNTNIDACKTFKSPSGKHVWTKSGVYRDTVANVFGCDSMVDINLTIDTVNVSVVKTPLMLKAVAVGARYQWLDCSSNMDSIYGDTSQVFIPMSNANGEYAVQVTQNGCVDTSECISINDIGLDKPDLTNTMWVYPNPSKEKVNIEMKNTYKEIKVVVRNGLSQEVSSQYFKNSKNLEVLLPAQKGVYFFEIHADDKRALIQVLKD